MQHNIFDNLHPFLSYDSPGGHCFDSMTFIFSMQFCFRFTNFVNVFECGWVHFFDFRQVVNSVLGLIVCVCVTVSVLSWWLKLKGSESKGEAKHCKCPTDTGANKRLLVPAGDQPGPPGISRIKRSAQRSRRQGGLGRALQSHTLCHPWNVRPPSCSGHWKLRWPSLLYQTQRVVLFTSNRLCPFTRREMMMEACRTEFQVMSLYLSQSWWLILC